MISVDPLGTGFAFRIRDRLQRTREHSEWGLSQQANASRVNHLFWSSTMRPDHETR
ncbi:hypothetical protein NSPZN2_50174 [Nitrospira defluvii]|uniref:Uncharacterized protein n=1 Tax=Nitrospira defluvii TaxID=330214 RepID=A0ABM8S3W0_9BACT|nr:hypothetical protein NSPZN2_50174 [Nitrospira defluvii]